MNVFAVKYVDTALDRSVRLRRAPGANESGCSVTTPRAEPFVKDLS